MTIRALIVDDEEPGRVNLRCALAEYPGWQVVAECASASAARRAGHPGSRRGFPRHPDAGRIRAGAGG
ncbi:hypothetical protein LP420_16370 [Massilia sp. B-10]|nr:hypothetical protein LP420_16370 [Massilia sp. B-10]